MKEAIEILSMELGSLPNVSSVWISKEGEWTFYETEGWKEVTRAEILEEEITKPKKAK